MKRLAMAAALGLLACARQDVVAEQFAIDFHCPEPIEVARAQVGGYIARGCGTEALYQCASSCEVQDARQEGTEGSAPQRVAAADAEAPLVSDIRIVNRAGQATLMLDLQLTRTAVLRLAAVPDKRADLMQLKLVRRDAAAGAQRCGLDWMVNNQPIQMPKAVATVDSRALSQRVQIGPGLMEELSQSDSIALRSCQERFALLKFQVLLVHEFIERLAQESAWKNGKRSGGAAGFRAPQGGWPEWSPASVKLSTLGGAALDPRELFKRLSVSVFQLEVKRAHGAAQGSAVAISEHELLTNCHVLEDAQSIVVRQGEAQWQGRVLSADPKADRCIVVVPEARLTPIAGVRPYDALEVGEPVYTLGAPVGLELTISDGILSGRREDAGHRYIQSTAPISPGSSGGGLFDSRGNLIGITTLAIVGRERLNQALNFAIPADAFWQN